MKKLKTDLEKREDWGKAYHIASNCRDRALRAIFSPAFQEYWDADIRAGIVRMSSRFVAGIDDGSVVEYRLSDLIDEVGKRSFRNRFPEDKKGLATALYYSFDF